MANDNHAILKINWFPGHMKKATDAIFNARKDVDVVLEIVDARGVNVSSNDEFQQMLIHKPFIKIALKADLSDANEKNYQQTFFASIYDKNLHNKVLNFLEKITFEKTQKLKNKGLVKPHYNVMVVGLPNVGKSSVINVLAQKNKAKTENRPGVTKAVTWIKLNDKFSLFDTPGILFKKIDEFASGAKLTLMGIINPQAVPLNEILLWGFNFFKKYYFKQLSDYYQLGNDLDYFDFLEHVAIKRKFLLPKNELDLERSASTFFNEVINGKIAKFSYDKN